MPVIDRHIINPDINYDGLNREQLFRLINRWKRLLHFKYEVSKGNVMALGIFDVNANHIACLFAAAELGLKIFILTKPLAKETIHATKMGIFGPVDITVTQDLPPDDLHVEMFTRYSKKICYEYEIDEVTNDSAVDILVDENDHLIFASTSGTTGKSKEVFFTHREVYEISKRNISVFGYTKNSVVQQTMNMHHASAMLTFLFPTLMTCDKHFYGSVAWGPHLMKTTRTPKTFIEFIITRGVDTVICSNMFFLKLLIEGYNQTTTLPEHRITVGISGFPATEIIYQYAKDYPINFISHYGSIDTGIPLLVNKINQHSRYEANYLGVIPDDFYKIDDNTVSSSIWNEDRLLADNLLEKDGKYYYQGRKLNNSMLDDDLYDILSEQVGDYDIVICDEDPILIVWNRPPIDSPLLDTVMNLIFKNVVYLNKEDFTVDTKVSMEQLRAYLEHHYAV